MRHNKAKLTWQEKKRYHRQMIHPNFDEVHQKRLTESTVLLAGTGGLGGAIAYGLAGAGVGKLILLHSGPLESPDLNRQTLMTETGMGQSRVEAAAKRLRAFNGQILVEAHDIAITEEILAPLFKGVDLIIDARHNFPERRALNRVATEKGVPLLFAAMNGMEAQMALFEPNETGCLDCLYPQDPPDWDSLGFPVFGAVAHSIGAMAAMEAIKYLSCYGEKLKKLLAVDMGDYSTHTFTLRPDPCCRTCLPFRTPAMAPKKFLKK